MMASANTALWATDYVTVGLANDTTWEVYHALPMIKVWDYDNDLTFDVDLTSVPNSKISVLRAIRDAAERAGFDFDPQWGDVDYFYSVYKDHKSQALQMYGGRIAMRRTEGVRKMAYTIDDLTVSQIDELMTMPSVMSFMGDVFSSRFDEDVSSARHFFDSIGFSFDYDTDAWDNFWPEVNPDEFYQEVIWYGEELPEGSDDGFYVGSGLFYYWQNEALPLLRKSYAEIVFNENGEAEDGTDDEFYSDLIYVASELGKMLKRDVEAERDDCFIDVYGADSTLAFYIEDGQLDDEIAEILNGDEDY